MGKGKIEFTKDEYNQLIELIRQKERSDSTKQKSIRSQIRKIGLYWEEVGKGTFDVPGFKKLFDQKILRIKKDVVLGPKNEDKVGQNDNKSNSSSKTTFTGKNAVRNMSDENYIIDLCDEIIGEESSRQHRFEFLVGDTGSKLPVDAYYHSLKLVIEYHEIQHTESTPFFDNKKTVSGVSRGEQRRLYDLRRQEVLPKHDIKLVIISYSDFGESKKLVRNRERDIDIVRKKLNQAGFKF